MKKPIDHNSAVTANTKKSILAALLLTGVAHLNPAQAATLPNGSSLTITSGTVGTSGYVSGGSYFGMDMNGNSSIGLAEKTAITSRGNIPIGSAITATGSHTGSINGSESPAFDIWEFFSNTGMDYLSVAATDNGNGTLGLSGWTVTWNGIAAIPMNARAWQPGNCAALGCTGWTFTDGTARFQWNGVNGGAYTLDYTATVPNGDPSGFGNVKYYLHLQGNVNAVPIPAAVWLFGSGLMGLFGLARRRKA